MCVVAAGGGRLTGMMGAQRDAPNQAWASGRLLGGGSASAGTWRIDRREPVKSSGKGVLGRENSAGEA